MHEDGLTAGSKVLSWGRAESAGGEANLSQVLVIDDLLGTGSTMFGACELVG